MMSNKAFSLIEVLIATLILSVSIMVISATLKQFFVYKNKLNKYQLIYTTTMSLIDKISLENLLKNPSSQGKLNGLKYKYKATIIERKTNAFSYISENLENQMQTGSFEIMEFMSIGQILQSILLLFFAIEP
ncbi:MAG TPA: prepilin-type N-terminal cleavage/methylation domain-containing protein [Hydrogenothermaceae bacterium]|nr:prepilin-type N-terminal cleavage/methylation domain-containing protein [Hydrogenothermaceae bacterium]